MEEFEFDNFNFSIELPDEKDKLFKEFNIEYCHNAELKSGKKWFLRYSEGYRLASEKLFAQLDGSAHNANLLVYPIVFISRQYIELSLKELINGLNYIRIEKYTFPCDHKLTDLWKEFHRLSVSIDESQKPQESILKNIERLIVEFDEIDNFSMNFRYPTDNSKEKAPSLKITNIDLDNFRITMNKISNFLTWQSNAIYHLIDNKEAFYYDLWRKFDKNYNPNDN
ncbi:hypothetical protein [Plebeiibacterium marinum]|uniref:HEPN domain-containing protein n=1 Tax=Plebeiibacterium marinum TaxID=2992111 RepID=A0AAE3MEE4_9BACT|nr:hypothetical protein [Plebeiobacterium marinum]MCW3806076.1 hypothetical protein [Plebeiobacterium marinum]